MTEPDPVEEEEVSSVQALIARVFQKLDISHVEGVSILLSMAISGLAHAMDDHPVYVKGALRGFARLFDELATCDSSAEMFRMATRALLKRRQSQN
jgi:hypothetical protein